MNNAMAADLFAADDSQYDASTLDSNRFMDNLRDEVKLDENIAMKSAIMLKLLQVRTQFVLLLSLLTLL